MVSSLSTLLSFHHSTFSNFFHIQPTPQAHSTHITTPNNTSMPRNGDGSSDNAIENTNDIIHGAGEVKVHPPLSTQQHDSGPRLIPPP